MGRRPQSKLGVAEASLYGARCRVIDLSRARPDRARLVEDQAEAIQRMAEAEAKVRVLGGDPDDPRLTPSHGVYATE